MSTTTATKKVRTRAVAVAEITPEQKVKELAASTFFSNKKMNAAKAEYDKARKELFNAMKDMGISSLSLDALNEEGVSVALEAVISTPTGQAVDVAKLQKLVTMDQFIKMASVTQKAVTDEVGGSILNQVLVNTVGTENVAVKARK